MFFIFPLFFIPFFVFFILPIILLANVFKSGHRGHCRDYDSKYMGSYNKDPIIPARATVIYKRGPEAYDTPSNNYIVFEFESRDRIELIVPKEDFNLIFEGERGTLTFQGRKFLKFDRFTN